MASQPLTRVHTYIVKVWLERIADPAEGGEWRGEARDVETSAVRYFRTLDGLVGALEELLAESDARSAD